MERAEVGLWKSLRKMFPLAAKVNACRVLLQSRPLSGCLRQWFSTSSSSDEESGKQGRKGKGRKGHASGEAADLNPDLVTAAKGVAQSIGGNEKSTESDLLLRLRQHAELTEAQKHGQPPAMPDVGSMFSGMKVERGRGGRPPRRHGSADDTRGSGRMSRRQGPNIEKRVETVPDIKLWSGPNLGIFKATEPPTETVLKSRQTLLEEIEDEILRDQMTFPPNNAFVEMIEWTKQGKLWKFPIDNEQGLGEEARVGFHEHVFLDRSLADFPKKGPVRHFMELVTTGLSKNPYLTIRQKKEHIDWFKAYFADKYKIIDDLTVKK